jgi:hypothetical protein
MNLFLVNKKLSELWRLKSFYEQFFGERKLVLKLYTAWAYSHEYFIFDWHSCNSMPFIFYFDEVIKNKGTSSTYILRLEIAKFLETLFYFVSVDLCVYFL